MKTKTLLITFCLGSALLGCSGSPDVGDIKVGMEEGWGSCKGLKLIDLKKTNGIAHGQTYEMAVSFKLEILNDATAQEAWYTDAVCPSPSMLQLLWAHGKRDNKFGQALKKGDVINANDVFEMVSSEKGWIIK